jgi:Fe-S-cluster containining protein
MLGDEGQCSVYDIRPVVCRLWACTPEMACPHGCRPDRFVLRKEGEHLLRRAREISDRLYGTGDTGGGDSDGDE